MLPIQLTPPSPHHSYKHMLFYAHRVMGKECHPLPTPRGLGSHTHSGTCRLGEKHINAQNFHLTWDTFGSLSCQASIRGAVVPIKGFGNSAHSRKIHNIRTP